MINVKETSIANKTFYVHFLCAFILSSERVRNKQELIEGVFVSKKIYFPFPKYYHLLRIISNVAYAQFAAIIW